MDKRFLAILLSAISIAGCGGGKTAPVVPDSASTAPHTRPEAIARFAITVPPALGNLKARYISSATKSVSIGLTGSTTSTTTIDVVTGPKTFYLFVKAFAGSNTFTVNLYDQAKGAGKLLSTAQVIATLFVNRANTVKVATIGIPVSIKLTLDRPVVRMGIATTVQLTVAANDADGNAITGPYMQAVNLTNSDTTGAIQLAGTTATGPTTLSVSYNGSKTGAASLGVSGFTGSVTTATLTPQLEPNGGVVTTLAGNGTSGYTDGTGTTAEFNCPYSVAVDGQGNLYIADTYGQRIRRLDTNGVVTTLAGDGTIGRTDGSGTAAEFGYPVGIVRDSQSNLYVTENGNSTIRKISSGNIVSTFAGDGSPGTTDGSGPSAEFNKPWGIAMDKPGNLYITEQGNNDIRMIDTSNNVTTLAGNGNSTGGFIDGTGTAAQFNQPAGIAVDGTGTLFVADQGNQSIRMITPGGVVTTLAGNGTGGTADGTGTAATFYNPSGVAFDGSGNLYITDTGYNIIRMITPGAVVTTLAGNGNSSGGFADGTGSAAIFNFPVGIAADYFGILYVADDTNQRIRRIL